MYRTTNTWLKIKSITPNNAGYTYVLFRTLSWYPFSYFKFEKLTTLELWTLACFDRCCCTEVSHRNYNRTSLSDRIVCIHIRTYSSTAPFREIPPTPGVGWEDIIDIEKRWRTPTTNRFLGNEFSYAYLCVANRRLVFKVYFNRRTVN